MGKAPGGLTPSSPGMCSNGIRMGPGEVGQCVEENHGKEHQASQPGAQARSQGNRRPRWQHQALEPWGLPPECPGLHTASFVVPRHRAPWEMG